MLHFLSRLTTLKFNIKGGMQATATFHKWNYFWRMAKHINVFFINRFLQMKIKQDVLLLLKDMKKDFTIKDVFEKEVSAMKVFSFSIKYLKDECQKLIGDRGFLPKNENLKFVLTVPAIWNDRSKLFMRDAAIQV